METYRGSESRHDFRLLGKDPKLLASFATGKLPSAARLNNRNRVISATN